MPTDLLKRRSHQPAIELARPLPSLKNTRSKSLGHSGLEILRRHTSLCASHKHNPNTATRRFGDTWMFDTWILAELYTWMDHPNPKHKIIWLSGLEGAGKSTTVRKAMQRAEREGRLGASFFFSRDTEDRSTADYLFPTISYQLTQNMPETARLIDSIMWETPNLPSKSLRTQFRELVERPVRAGKMGSIPYPLVAIDGLDECNNGRVQENLIAIIGEAVKFQLPLRFLISSRPEPWIQAALEKYSAFTWRIALGTSDELVSSFFEYMSHGFDNIQKRHSQFMQGIPPEWPAMHEMWDIKKRSAGQFSYVDTVLKFVGDNEYLNPVHQLKIVLRPPLEMTNSSLTSPYPELDRLYFLILSDHPNPPKILQILTFFVTPDFEPFPDLLDNLLNVDHGTVLSSLKHVHPLVNFSESDTVNYPSTLHHVSFQDFLNDPTRSQNFYINKRRSSRLVRQTCFDLMIRWLREAAQGNDTVLSIIYAPAVIRHPHKVRYCPSKRQDSVLYICKYLSGTSTNQLNVVVKLLKAYSFIHVELSDATAFLLNQLLGTMRFIDEFSRKFHVTCIQTVYKGYLLDKRSSQLNSLMHPPWIFAIDLLPVTLLAQFSGVEQSALLQTCYPVLDYSELRMGLHLAKLDSQFTRYIQTTKRFRQYFQDSKQKEDSLIVIAKHCLQLLFLENDQEEREVLEQALGRISAQALIPNFDSFLLYLAALKTRPLDDWNMHGATHAILNNIATMINYDRPQDADMVANVSKELMYITNDSPPSIKIYPCFLHLRPWADLTLFQDLNDETSIPLPSSGIDCPPHLSGDFRHFFSTFNRLIFRFLTDGQRAGNFYVPQDILHEDLKTLITESTQWFSEKVRRPPAQGEYVFQRRDVGVGRG